MSKMDGQTEYNITINDVVSRKHNSKFDIFLPCCYVADKELFVNGFLEAIDCERVPETTVSFEDIGAYAEVKEYPLSDWQYEVANGDTQLGYADWCRHKAEADSA